MLFNLEVGEVDVVPGDTSDRCFEVFEGMFVEASDETSWVKPKW